MTAFERIERRETVTTETVWTYTPGAAPEPKASIRVRYVTRYRVSGVAAVSLYEGDRGRLYVPTTVTVEQHGPSEPSVTVLGRLLRKDGSLGENTQTIHRFGWRRRADWPEWLAEIAADAATTNPRGDQ